MIMTRDYLSKRVRFKYICKKSPSPLNSKTPRISEKRPPAFPELALVTESCGRVGRPRWKNLMTLIQGDAIRTGVTAIDFKRPAISFRRLPGQFS